MSECAFCNKDKDSTEFHAVWTGKIASVDTRGNRYTTTYKDFTSHGFYVCKPCNIKWSWVFPVVISIIITIIILIIVGRTREDVTDLFLVLFLILTPVLIAFFHMKVFDIDRILVRRAKRLRKKQEPSKMRYIGFTDPEYRQLTQKNWWDL